MPPHDPRLVSLRDSLLGQVLLGTRGARYHLRERVGEGGQGWVFRASWDDPEGYAVIVKVLRPDSVTPESLTRFEREAQVLRMLGQAARPNPHVVRFFDYATARLAPPSGGNPIDLPFIVLEYVNGPTLEHVLARSRGVGLALDRVRRVGRQIALALDDVHAHKIVHRDLKPSNVLLSTEAGGEIAKVTDFGLVKLADVGLGKTTALAGASLGYAPPEQFEQGNRRVGTRTDVFSFAAMLYEMLTGVKAFPYGEGENPLVVVTRLLNGPRPSVMNTRGAVPHELALRVDLRDRLDALIVRATAAEPADRPASTGELWAGVEALLRAASERPSHPVTAPPHVPDKTTALDLRAFPPVAMATTPSPGEGARAPAEPAFDTTARQASNPADGEGPFVRPSAWSWRVLIPSLRAGVVRAAAFDPGGESAVAMSTSGLMTWQSTTASGWTGPPAGASDIDPRRVRGLTWLRSGELVVFGERAFAGRLVPGAALESWAVPDPDMTFLGAFADPPGTTVTFVGERPARRNDRAAAPGATTAVFAQFARGRLILLSDVPSCARLRGVARLRSGGIVGCGDRGAIVRLELGVPESLGSVCGGHLHAIAPLGAGALTVGAGGHALSLSSSLEAQLEAVQTTRDLLALAVDAQGVAWAGSAQARLLRRTAGSWVRMSADLGLSSSVVALWASLRTVRGICDDGAIIEGFVADDHIDR